MSPTLGWQRRTPCPKMPSACPQLLTWSKSTTVQSSANLNELSGYAKSGLVAGRRSRSLCQGHRVLLQTFTQRWVLTFELRRSADENLLHKPLQQRIIELIRRRAFHAIGGGLICSSMSRAVRPAVRSAQYPEGMPDCRETMRLKVAQGNEHSTFMASCVTAAVEAGCDHWTENPHTSFLWKQPPWEALLETGSATAGRLHDSFVTDYCRFGTKWLKRTKIYSSLGFKGQKLLCRCKGPHQRLSGFSRAFGMMWTKAAESYPRQLNHLIARALAETLKPVRDRHAVDASAICRSSTCRIGEAKNPGPAVGDLEEVALVGERTRVLQSRLLEEFFAWLRAGLSPPALASVETCAMVFCCLLRSYGNHLFSSGQPLYKWRHLCAYYQKNKLLLRPYMPLCWDLVTRWERVQPTRHREPVPWALIRAILALAGTGFALLLWPDWPFTELLELASLCELFEPTFCCHLTY